MSLDELTWKPYCGAVYPLEKVAGDPVICDRNPHDGATKHRNSETGFEWWGGQ